MTIRITIIASNVYDANGIRLIPGTINSVPDGFGRDMITQLKASDTDNVLSSTGTVVRGNDPFNEYGSFPSQCAVSRTLRDSDNGETLNCTAGITLTIPTGLRANWAVTIVQASTSQVTLVAATGVTLNNVSSQSKTSGQYAVVGLIQTTPNNYILAGSTAA